MLNKISLLLSLFFILTLLGCSSDNSTSSSSSFGNFNPGGGNDGPPPPPPGNDNEVKYRWDVPGGGSEIIMGCLGLDCIPSLENPELISAQQATYLKNDDLVFGVVHGDDIRAYPYRILDWHEIINQDFNGANVAVTYCPLTGSAVGIDVSRTALQSGASLKTFGISGLIYNNNLIPYDRGTRSNWSQMLLRCVNGVLRGTPMVTIPFLETSWRTWKKMFPDTKVVSNNTGFDRPYNIFPYGNYKTDPFLLFPIMVDDTRLTRKERLHGIIADRFNPKAKTYRFTLFENGARAINDEVEGEPVVVAGMKSADFYVSYSRVAQDGTVLSFQTKTESPHIYPFDLVDEEGNVWNILGEAVSGPRAGEKLNPTLSYNAYWFAWGTFFPGVQIVQ